MIVSFNPTDASFLQNPYPTYARLRQNAPIFFYEPWGKWVLTRYEDINVLLRDKRLGRVIHHRHPELAPPQKSEYAAFHAIQQGSLLEIEPPDHSRIRAVVHTIFTPKHVRQLSEKVTALCERLADDMGARLEREANLITEFAEPIPVTVIAELLGVPESDRHLLVPWSKAIIGMFEPEGTPEMARAANSAAQEFSDYLRELIKAKREQPQNDLISRMVEVHDTQPDKISESEIVANGILFLDAGHEAVVNVIGNGMLALLRHPEALQRLRDDLDLAPTAIEEMLRFDSPLQFFERYVLEDIEYKGHTWAKGSKLCLFYASANHDPAVFDHPETFDITRQPNPHIAFGLGLHYCIGAPLARVELQAALTTLLTRFPKLRLLTEQPEYHPKNVFHYLKELRVAY